MSRLLVGARQVVTCRGPARSRHGAEMAHLEVLTGDPAVLISDAGVVERVGKRSDISVKGASEVEVDGVIFPGFVDSHTHSVFGEPRTADHERRARGVDYKEIAAAGGGILSSVRSVRETPLEALKDKTAARLSRVLELGTTAIEVKSGYGLDLANEIKQLEVIASLKGESPALIPTFLGAHEVPPNFRDEPERYIDEVVNVMIPEVEARGLARFCDVFCEPGVFTVDQSRRILTAAREHGMKLKLHADELDGSGGAELAVEMGAVSADHLAAISESGISAIAESATVAVILPGTMLFLGKTGHAPVREIIDRGGSVALATDFNPGSSPGMSLPLMGMLGVSQLKMVAAEAVIAITVNGAAAVGEAAVRGQLAPGFAADLVIADLGDWRELVYWYGTNPVTQVWVGGRPCDTRRGNLN